MLPHVRPLGTADVDPYIEHLSRQMSGSGRAGLPIFSPYPLDTVWTDSKAASHRRESVLERWRKTLEQPSWERVWAIEIAGVIRGHVDLRGDSMATGLHRASLGMGIEAPWHRQGFGSALLEAAVDWARQGEKLAWIDLYVFAHNEPALSLYRKFGFTERGRTPDRFRVGGQRIEDVHMTLLLPDPA